MMQVSFNLGQIDKGYFKRFDGPDSNYYSRAAQNLTNFLITSSGKLTRRMGTFNFKEVTDIIAGRSDVKFFILTLYVTDQSIQKFACVRVSTELYIGLLQYPLTFSLVNLTEFSSEQIKTAYFGVLRSDIVICHPQVNPVRIQYNGSVFTKSDFQFSVQATFDLDSSVYAASDVIITPPSSPSSGDPTTIELTPNPFGADATDFLNGYITGPGTDPYSPFGTGTISAVVIGTGNVTFTVNTNTPFAAKNSASKCTGSKLSIQKPIFNTKFGFPGFVVSFQNRAWFGGHPLTPQTLYGTVLGTENNLDLGTGDPTDAIVYSIAIQNVGKILYFNVGHQFEVYCEKAMLTLYQNLQGGITPTTFTLKAQSQNSPVSATCRPIVFDYYSFFSGAESSTVYSLNQNEEGDENTYKPNLETVFAKSLVPDPIKLVPFLGNDGSSVMLAVLNSNGILSIFTLNEGQEISGWTPFKFTSDFSILDIDSDGLNLYLLVKYFKTNKTVIELFDYSNSFFVDHAIEVSIPASTSPQVVSGLSDLEGETIYIAGFAEALGPFKVVGGSVTVPPVSSNKTLYAGVDSGVMFIPMYFYDNPDTGYFYKSINRFYLSYEDSLAISINGYDVPFDQVEPIEPQTDTFEFIPVAGYTRFQTLSISQYAPVCLTITGLTYYLDTASK